MMIGIIQKDISLNQLTLNLNMLTVQLLSLKTMNIQPFFSGESEKEYFIQRSCDLEHWEILEGNIQPVLKSKLIFDEQQQKKALVPTEDIGNDWIQLNYDDSNWLM